MGEPEDKLWRTAGGREIHIERMTEVHIWNVMTMIRRKLDAKAYARSHVCPESAWEPCPFCDGDVNRAAKMERWLEVFRIELLRRGMPTEPVWDIMERANKAYEDK